MSLKGTLPEIYNALLETNGYHTVNQFLDRFAPPGTDTADLRIDMGQRLLSELTPKILKKYDAFRVPIYIESLPESVQRGLMDPDLQAVIEKAEPDYDFEVGRHTLGGLIRLPIIQQIGMGQQIAHTKKNEFLACIDTLNDPKIYKKVVSDVARDFPDLLPHLSQQHYTFSLDMEDKDIVKDTYSIWQKADKYQPDDFNEGCAGTLGIRDMTRIRIIPTLDQDFTFQEYTNMRNQLSAYLLTEKLDGFHMTRLKDNLSDTVQAGGEKYNYPACNIHGVQDSAFPLKNNETVIARLASEIQFVPKTRKIKDFDKITVAERLHRREEEKLGIGDGQHALVHNAMIENMWREGMPHMNKAVQGKYPDPSKDIIDKCIISSQRLDQEQKSTPSRHRYRSKRVIDLSFTDNIYDLTETGQIIIRQMIAPPKQRSLQI